MCVVLLLASSARGQEPVQQVRSEDGKCSVEVPASWQVTVGGAKPTSLLRFEATVEGVDDAVICNVWLLQGQRHAQLQPFLDAGVKGAQPDALSATPEVVPFPYLVVRSRADGGEEVEATAYAMVRRNGVNAQLKCDAKAWPGLRDAFLHMASSMRAELEEWPPHPPAFRRELKDGFVYLVDPRVKAADVSRLQSIATRTLQRFEKAHGKVPMPEENPPLVVVHNSLADARHLYEDVSTARFGAEVDELGGRVFLTPVPAERGPERAACVKGIVHLLYIQLYGWNDAYWMYVGEGRAAWSEERCGQEAPRVDQEIFRSLPSNPITFAALVGMEEEHSGEDAFSDNALAYVLLFGAGPRKYRTAYDAFKAALAATHDVRRSMAEHLLSLDQEEMRKDLDRWLRRSVKAVERK